MCLGENSTLLNDLRGKLLLMIIGEAHPATIVVLPCFYFERAFRPSLGFMPFSGCSMIDECNIKLLQI